MITETGTVISQPKYWNAFDFYRMLTQAERIAIRTLALTDPLAQDFMHTLDNAIASSSRVLSNDPDLIAGMNYLAANPASAPVFSHDRVSQILN